MSQTVLAVDDSPEIHRLLDARLRNENVTIHHALDGEEGFTLACSLLPDLILLDVVMPQQSGFDVCERLKRTESAAQIPIIFLTGTTDAVNKVHGFDLGAVDYITKPFDAAELRARVRAALRTKRYQDMLTHRAMLDAMTGLWNRAFFDQRLKEELLAADRYGRELSLVLLDVDHFKQLNDTCGHPFGDLVLQTVGEVLLNTARASDLPFRYGGEEFGVVLRETNLDEALQTAERIRSRIAELPFRQKGQDIRITASFGVASNGLFAAGGAVSPQQLIAAADAALYSAKHSGRNRTCVSPPASCSTDA